MDKRVLAQRKAIPLINNIVRFQVAGATLFLIFCFVIQIFIGSYTSFPWVNAIAFLSLFLTTLYEPRISLKLLVFTVPFIDGFFGQINAIFKLNFFVLDLLCIDASIGWLAGLFFRNSFINKTKYLSENLSVRASILNFLLLIFNFLIILTVAIAISRNLYQAASLYSTQGFFYNLANVRMLGWHDDYFPLKDLFIFTTAITLSFRILTLVRTQSQLIRSVLFPLLSATVIILSYALWSKFTGIGYFRDGVEAGTNSFLPDIHAYGGYALAAFVGGLYYLTSSHKEVKIAAVGFLLLVAAGVIVSGSRFSIGILFILVLIYIYFFFLKNPKKHSFIFAFLSLLSILILILFNLNLWGSRGLIEPLQLLTKSQSFTDINIALSYRPELFRSALLMYSYYPILGLGKGIFYRQSSIYGFSQSPFFSSLNNGENAHNYFLQTLAEMGFIGFGVFCFIFLYQGLYLRNKHNQIITVLILGIFLGNLYGHSLLIPNILLLLFIMLGSTNIQIEDEDDFDNLIWLNMPFNLPWILYWRYLILILATLLVIGSIVEVKSSYGKIPFQQHFVCYKKNYYSDNHTDGLFERDYIINNKKITIEYTAYHPYNHKNPLIINFNIYQKGQKIAAHTRTIKSPGKYQEEFDISGLSNGSNILLQIQTSRCFTPINLGFNRDNRRLGIQLNQVFQD